MKVQPRQTPTKDSIVVLSSTLADDDDGEEDIITSNVAFVNMLFEEYLARDEIAVDALRSYHVDYFLAEFENGGFSQFVYNTRWDKDIVADIRDGLAAMRAKKHLKAFELGIKLVEKVDRETLEAYFEGNYFHGDEDEPEEEPVDWDTVDEALNKAGDAEDLYDLHVDWLRNHPQLFPMQTAEDMLEEARRRGAALPDRAQRIAKSLANEPRYLKLIRALCKEAGQDLEELTAIDPQREVAGEVVHAYHFITDHGHHHMIEHDGKAIMFRGHSTTDEVCSIDTAPEVVLH